MSGAREQFVTGVFELRPTRRKAAALERVRFAAEDAFWAAIDILRNRAEAVAGLPKKDRKVATSAFGAEALAVALRAGVSEPVAHGLARDVASVIAGFLEARANGRNAAWPQRRDNCGVAPLAERLDAVRCAIALDDEAASRNALNAREMGAPARPIMLARERDCRIVRGSDGSLAVLLNVVRASDERAKAAAIRPGTDACTGEVLSAGSRKRMIALPIACSRWHENKFLSGRMHLRSAVVFPRGGRWWLQAQFAAHVPAVPLTGRVVGIDRGVVHPVAVALVDGDGAVLDVPGRVGTSIGKAVAARGEVLRRQQRNGAEKRVAGLTRSAGEAKARTRIGRRIDHDLHALANGIVETAAKHGAVVALENLDGLKATMLKKRVPGARKGGWSTVLRKAHFAKLEKILAYKLPMAGLPLPREVIAAGTSRTCPACAHADAKNRPEQATFKCTSCGFEQNADENAAVIIARRGTMEIKKGDRLDALHSNMVERLRSRDDGGLGPLASRRRVVAAHVSADRPNASEGLQEPDGLNLSVGQNVTLMAAENPVHGYSQSAAAADRGGPQSGVIGCGCPGFVGWTQQEARNNGLATGCVCPTSAE